MSDYGFDEVGADTAAVGAAGRDIGLLAEVAHDIRSPLTSILFLVESMRGGQSGPITAQQRHHLGLIYTATFELNTLVNDLTELAHAGGRSLPRHAPAQFALSDVLASVRDLVLPIAEQRQLELRVEQDAADLRLGHPAAITRVLLNLATNALRVTAQGGVTLCAHDEEDDRVELAVQDTGPGIAAAAMTSLFQPFTQHGRGRRGVSGAGLGLTICRRVVRELGGELAVESTLGEGSRFHFRLRLPRVV